MSAATPATSYLAGYSARPQLLANQRNRPLRREQAGAYGWIKEVFTCSQPLQRRQLKQLSYLLSCLFISIQVLTNEIKYCGRCDEAPVLLAGQIN